MAKLSFVYPFISALFIIFFIINPSSSARPLGSPEERVVSCEMVTKKSSERELVGAQRGVGGRHGPLLLTMLPKGQKVPPSGPSPIINGGKN
ncbi:hypothetical protein NMG60_11012066 [Bertholletia excelsa]